MLGVGVGWAWKGTAVPTGTTGPGPKNLRTEGGLLVCYITLLPD